MIALNKINYTYPNGTKVLHDISLSIKEGEVTVIIGKNGSGKSTLGNVIAAIYKNKKNNIMVEDKLLIDYKESDIRKKIGIVFQNPNHQIIFGNVKEDILFALNNLNVPKEEVENRICSSLKLIGMAEYLNANMYELSMGQKQRIAIAAILALKPNYIVFDEVTSMLDMEGKNAIYRIIKELKEQGIGIVFITNHMDEILLGDNIVFLDKGSVEAELKKENQKEIITALEQLGFELTIYYKLLKASFTDLNEIKKVLNEERIYVSNL